MFRTGLAVGYLKLVLKRTQPWKGQGKKFNNAGSMPAMWMKVFGYLHITPRGGSQPWKPMLWNSQRAIFILMLMPEEVWNCNYQASRVLLTFENVRVNGCLFLCGSPMTEGKWSRVYPASHPVIAGIGSSLPATLMDEGQMKRSGGDSHIGRMGLSEISVQKIPVLGTADILRRTLKIPGFQERTQAWRTKTTCRVSGGFFYMHM